VPPSPKIIYQQNYPKKGLGDWQLKFKNFLNFFILVTTGAREAWLIDSFAGAVVFDRVALYLQLFYKDCLI
jgi:hypothetical protein